MIPRTAKSPSLFRKRVNNAVKRLSTAKKMNSTKLNIDGHGAVAIDLLGQAREDRARRNLQDEVQRRKYLTGMGRLLLNQPAAEKLIRIKKFQARKEEKDKKFS